MLQRRVFTLAVMFCYGFVIQSVTAGKGALESHPTVINGQNNIGCRKMIHQTPEDQSSTETTVVGEASYLVTASGQIKCLRCTAQSSTTKQQYKRPALKSSKAKNSALGESP